MDAETAFGAWLKRRRRALDLTQAELACRACCTAESIRKLEAGRQRPPKPLAARLAEALALPSEERAAFVALARMGEAGTDRAEAGVRGELRRREHPQAQGGRAAAV